MTVVIKKAHSHTTSSTTGGTSTFNNVENMYDGNTTTSGSIVSSVQCTSSTTKSQNGFVFLHFSLSNIPSGAICTQIKMSVKGHMATSTASNISTSGAANAHLYDGISPIGATLTIDPTDKTYSSTESNASVLNAFINSTDPNVRLRCYVSAKKKVSSAASATVSNTFYVYHVELEITYKLPVNVKTKVNGTWEEGTVKVKANDTWVDAKKIFVKANGSWEEI